MFMSACLHVSISPCFHVSCLCLHVSMSPFPCLRLHVYRIPLTENETNGKFEYPFVCRKRKTEMANFCLFKYCKQKRKTEICYLFVGKRQTVIDNCCFSKLAYLCARYTVAPFVRPWSFCSARVCSTTNICTKSENFEFIWRQKVVAESKMVFL
jgi:hypothetical protein